MYSLNDSGREREHIFNSDEKKCLLQTEYIDNKVFEKAINWYYDRIGLGEIPLSHLTRKIELQQDIQI